MARVLHGARSYASSKYLHQLSSTPPAADDPPPPPPPPLPLPPLPPPSAEARMDDERAPKRVPASPTVGASPSEPRAKRALLLPPPGGPPPSAPPSPPSPLTTPQEMPVASPPSLARASSSSSSTTTSSPSAAPVAPRTSPSEAPVAPQTLRCALCLRGFPWLHNARLSLCRRCHNFDCDDDDREERIHQFETEPGLRRLFRERGWI